MASSAKLSNPVAIRCAKVVAAGSGIMVTSIVKIPEIPILIAMGTPITSKIIKLTTSTITPKNSITLQYFGSVNYQ